MFASEGILLNPTVACLEFHKNASKWTIRDVIVTTRAIYFFAGVRPDEKKESSLNKRKTLDKKGMKGVSPERVPQVEIIANYLDCKYEHHWNNGDLVFWDNRATIHYRPSFDSNVRRVLKRVTIGGEMPF